MGDFDHRYYDYPEQDREIKVKENTIRSSPLRLQIKKVPDTFSGLFPQRLSRIQSLDPGQSMGRRRQEPGEGRARPGRRVLLLPVRNRGGQEGRRVLYPALRGSF